MKAIFSAKRDEVASSPVSAIDRRRKLVDDSLLRFLDRGVSGAPDKLRDAMEYSVSAGGKRVRPVVLLSAGVAVGGDEEMTAKGKETSFEEALKQLEAIVAKLETGDAKLEESIRLFEEGMRLSGICQKRLDEADRKIEILLRKPGGVTEETEDESDILGKEG